MKKTVPSSLLSRIVIDSPCHESWDAMTGNERSRHCASCKKNVFNLTEMTEQEALQLIGKGSPICVRLYRRPDGSVLTKECGAGIRKRWQTRAMLSAACVAILVSLGLRKASADDSQIPAGQNFLGEIQAPESYEMGDVVMPEPTATASPQVSREEILMGRIANNNLSQHSSVTKPQVKPQ